jgi:uncharacterized SAM-binding protein YcdF (DUF218 family)
MPRALEEFRAMLPEIRIIPWPVDQESIDLSGWWRHGRTVGLLNREYLKFLASLVITKLAHPA